MNIRQLEDPAREGAESAIPVEYRRFDRLVQGAVNGFEAWLWYGVAEYLLGQIGPVLLRPYSVLMVEQWRGMFLLLVCYACIGCGLGTALLVDRLGKLTLAEFSRRSRTLLALTIIVAFAVNIAVTRGVSQKTAEILAASLIAGAVVWSARRTDPDRFFRHPAAVALTLVASGRLACGLWMDLPAIQAIPLALAATLGMIVAAVAVVRLASWYRSSAFWSPALAHSLGVLTIVGLVAYPGIVCLQRAETRTPVAGSSSAPDRPNILLITMDTTRADHMGLYGYARKNTPNLTELSKDATLYTNFIASSGMTLSSHASMFTGLYPQSHGAFMHPPDSPTGRPLTAGIPTAAGILGSAGYQTMAVVANCYYLSPPFGLVRGFQYAWTPRPVAIMYQYHNFLLRNRLRRILRIRGAMQDFDRNTLTAEEINRRALVLLDEAGNRRAPFFLFLNYMDAHVPYLPPPPFDTMYPGFDPGFRAPDPDAADGKPNAVQHVFQPAELAHLFSQYDGAIAYIDNKLGELVEHLKRTGQYDRTMIIVTSDHGEALGERGKLGHNVSSYQDQIQVPLLIKYPRGAQPGTVSALAGHIDLLPTVLEVAGLPAPKDLPGTSLVHLADAGPRSIVSERHENGAGAGRVSYAMFSGSSKLIYFPDGKPELYDLSNDPAEQHDLYRPEVASNAAFSHKVQEWIRLTPRPYTAQAPIDPEELKRLRSLGYVQ